MTANRIRIKSGCLRKYFFSETFRKIFIKERHRTVKSQVMLNKTGYESQITLKKNGMISSGGKRL